MYGPIWRVKTKGIFSRLHYFVEAVSQSHSNIPEKLNVTLLLRTDIKFCCWEQSLEQRQLPALQHPRPFARFDISMMRAF